MIKTDVLIVGASLAGASLALQLSKKNIKTIIIDKSVFPRRKPCGEGFSHLAINEINNLGLLSKLNSKEFIKLESYKVLKNSKTIELTGQNYKGYGISRRELDSLLLDEIKDNNINFIQNEKLVNLDYRNEIVIAKTTNHLIEAKFIVAADGYNSYTAKISGLKFKLNKNNRFALSSIWKIKNDLKSVMIIPMDDFELYFTPISEDKLNYSIVGTKNKVQEFKDSKKFEFYLDYYFKQDKELLEKPVGVGPFERVFYNDYSKRILLVGDAAETFDPISGMGMYHALLSSRLASNAISSAITNEYSSFFKQYDQLRNENANLIRGYTSLTKSYLHNNFLYKVNSKLPNKIDHIFSDGILGRKTITSKLIEFYGISTICINNLHESLQSFLG